MLWRLPTIPTYIYLLAYTYLVSQPLYKYKNILLRVKIMFLYSLVIVVIVSLDSFSQATPCENCGTCIPILEYCNVYQEDANVMENLVIDQSISAGARASFRPSPNAPSDLKIQEKEESRERCLIETFLAVGRDRPSRNLKCQVKFQ